MVPRGKNGRKVPRYEDGEEGSRTEGHERWSKGVPPQEESVGEVLPVEPESGPEFVVGLW